VIRINLLPHREEKRKARREQFFALIGLVVVLAGAIWFLGFTAINRYITVQETKNAYIEREIESLKKEIAAIAKLKEETDALLKRKQVIETLQGSRAETTRMFDELLRRVPDGIRLVNFVQNGMQFDLSGESVSEARVSSLMRSLEESPLFQQVNMLEIRAANALNGRPIYTFLMRMAIERAAPAAADTKNPAKKSAGDKP